ncbi:uncharacterized protein LOC135090184 [Scylla paramamosain]|uniref:uncharacterized protein LOC135090184 n=1 Tax=Scylla paramamosain TaxID=85552 RepID=UPI0030833F73
MAEQRPGGAHKPCFPKSPQDHRGRGYRTRWHGAVLELAVDSYSQWVTAHSGLAWLWHEPADVLEAWFRRPMVEMLPVKSYDTWHLQHYHETSTVDFNSSAMEVQEDVEALKKRNASKEKFSCKVSAHHPLCPFFPAPGGEGTCIEA